MRPGSRMAAKRSVIWSGGAGAGADRVLDVGQDPVQGRECRVALRPRAARDGRSVCTLWARRTSPSMPRRAMSSASRLGRRDREHHRAADARLGRPGRRLAACRPCACARSRRRGRRRLVDRAGPHQVHAVTAGRHRAPGIPERDRVLERLRRERNRREVVVRAVRARDLAGRERVADDAERVLETLLRLRPVAAEPVVLDRRDSAADAEVEAAAGELVDHAHVLDDLDRVMQRQQLHHRAEPDLRRHLRGGRDEHLLVGRHAQVGAVVLGEMETREARLVGERDQLEPILEQPVRRRAGNVLDVVEDAEGRCRQGDRSSR